MDHSEKLRQLETELAGCRREIGELNALIRSMELINSTLQLDVILDHLMGLAREVTHSEAASVLLIEDDKLYFAAASGVKSGVIKRVQIARGEGIAGWVLEHGEPLVIDDVSRDARFTGSVDNTSGFVTRSILAVPLFMEGALIGVIETINKNGGGRFIEDDTRRLTALASSAAIAIHEARLHGDLNELFLSTITALANAIEAKDRYTRGHSERIRDISLLMAKEMELAAEEVKNLEISALLHDVGKIGVPESVLGKQGKLTDEERAEIMKHPAIGAGMLAGIKQLKAVLSGIRYHQERYDGKGYPEGLAGTSIPLFARIIAVADTFDAMTSDRPYRAGLPDSAALAEIERFRGIQFDQDCVAAFQKAYAKGLVKSQRREKEERAGEHLAGGAGQYSAQG